MFMAEAEISHGDLTVRFEGLDKCNHPGVANVVTIEIQLLHWAEPKSEPKRRKV